MQNLNIKDKNILELKQLLQVKDVKIDTLNNDYAKLIEQYAKLNENYQECIKSINIENLTTAIEGKKLPPSRSGLLRLSSSFIYSYCGGYKNQVNMLEGDISTLERQIDRLKADLIKSQAIIDEYRHHIYKK